MVESKITEKLLPVLVGYNYEHVMGKAVIEQKPKHTDDAGVVVPAEVIITITSRGEHAQILGDFVAANEVVALSFGGVPVVPISKKENHA